MIQRSVPILYREDVICARPAAAKEGCKDIPKHDAYGLSYHMHTAARAQLARMQVRATFANGPGTYVGPIQARSS